MATPKPPPGPYQVIATAPIGSPAWLDAYDQLRPADQQAIMSQQTMADGSNTFNYEDAINNGASLADLEDAAAQGGGVAMPYTPPMPTMGGAPSVQVGGYTGPSIDPATAAILQAMGPVNLPQYTSTGKLDPRDLGQVQASNNLLQDRISSLMDMGAAAILGGPGALDPMSFDPIVTPPTRVIRTPSLDLLNNYASGNGTDYKSWLARKIKGGMNDAEAAAALFQFLNEPELPQTPENMPAIQAREALRQSMPTSTYIPQGLQLPSETPGVGVGVTEPRTNAPPANLGTNPTAARQLVPQIDVGQVYQDAANLYGNALQDQTLLASGWTDTLGQYGTKGAVYYDAPKTTESKATKHFHDLGLPTPFETYMDPSYIKMYADTYAPNGAAEAAAADAAKQRADTEFAAARQASDEADKRAQDYANALDDYHARQAQVAKSNANWQNLQYGAGLYGAGVIGPTPGKSVAPPTDAEAYAASLPAPGGMFTPGPAMMHKEGNDLQWQWTGPIGPMAPAPGGMFAPVGGMAHAPDLGTPDYQPANPLLLPNRVAAPVYTYGGQLQSQAETPAQTFGGIFNYAPRANLAQTQGYQAQPQRLTQSQVQQARVEKAAADRRFVQANVERFHNQIAPAPQSSFEMFKALWNAMHSQTTPFQDVMFQRMAGQGAAGAYG